MAVAMSENTKNLIQDRKDLYSKEVDNSAKGLLGIGKTLAGAGSGNYVSAFSGAISGTVAQYKTFGYTVQDMKNVYDTAVSAANDAKGYKLKDKLAYYKDVLGTSVKESFKVFGEKIKSIGDFGDKAKDTIDKMKYDAEKAMSDDRTIEDTNSSTAKMFMEHASDDKSKKFAAMFGTAIDGARDWAKEFETKNDSVKLDSYGTPLDDLIEGHRANTPSSGTSSDDNRAREEIEIGTYTNYGKDDDGLGF